MELNEIASAAVSRWTDPTRRPLFKGTLIDSSVFDAGGNFTGDVDSGCACAQGDVLLHSGYSPRDLREMSQLRADEETAKLLGISVTHAILLRQVNDGEDGCPQDVLTAPEKILGPHTPAILAFWLHIDRMTDEQWRAAWDARAARAARDAWDAWAARAAWDAWAARAARAAWAAWAARAARAAWAAWAARAARAAWDIAYAALAEIAEIKWLPEHERGEFVFLPMFGFENPAAVLAAK